MHGKKPQAVEETRQAPIERRTKPPIPNARRPEARDSAVSTRLVLESQTFVHLPILRFLPDI